MKTQAIQRHPISTLGMFTLSLEKGYEIPLIAEENAVPCMYVLTREPANEGWVTVSFQTVQTYQIVTDADRWRYVGSFYSSASAAMRHVFEEISQEEVEFIY